MEADDRKNVILMHSINKDILYLKHGTMLSPLQSEYNFVWHIRESSVSTRWAKKSMENIFFVTIGSNVYSNSQCLTDS